MVLLPPRKTLTQNEKLLKRGLHRANEFCLRNGVPATTLTAVDRVNWWFDVCAYYREDRGIVICPDLCGKPCGHEMSRNWSWPGSTTDRTVYGVIAHELGHHCDVIASRELGLVVGGYSGGYGHQVMKQSGEKPISGYAPNPAEWFAEMFRVFVTNHALLYLVRPRTWEILNERWQPVSSDNWLTEIGEDCPERVIVANERKFRG